MNIKTGLLAGAASLALIGFSPIASQTAAAQAVNIGNTDIGGVVTGAKGPEAGVWVIAETTDLPTKYAKIVVTDDQGRYVLPELPKANYSVWVRGYGLVDSPKTTAAPGKLLNLNAVPAPSEAAAAEYYPALYWYSMLKIPDAGEFPGTGGNGNGTPIALKNQQMWLQLIKTDGCYPCHQIGDKATRTIPKELGSFPTGRDAWERRIQSGPASINMVNTIGRLNTQKALELFGDWTDRIAKGELPFAKPPRPQGMERNVVVTLWDWADPKVYLHDQVSTDRRNPTVNAYGLIYGSPEESTDNIPVLDPVKNVASRLKIPVRDVKTPNTKMNVMLAPSPYFGEDNPWDSQTNTHNPMFDEKGRIWFTSRIRPAANPDFCKKGSQQVSAKLFPLDNSGRQVAMYDPTSKKFTLVNTCYGTHHLQFGYDANNTLWTSAGGGGGAVGWVNTKLLFETGDEKKAQGWTAVVLDTNGNGKRDAYVEPDAAVDPAKDKRLNVAFYGVSPNPTDGSVWGSTLGFPGGIVRIVPGGNPPATALAEYYEPPWDNAKVPMRGYSPRGVDIDTKGVVWVPLASGHMASFDRTKCKGPLNGPNATGQHCPEGWMLTPFPGPQFKGVADSGSAEASYYTWVDHHDTLGLGKDVPFATGNASDSLMALIDGKFMVMRVPYPIGFFAKGMDGRIDDPKLGWKGRGLWSTYGTRTPFHMEGGKGQVAKVVHFQMRPDPLAR